MTFTILLFAIEIEWNGGPCIVFVSGGRKKQQTIAKVDQLAGTKRRKISGKRLRNLSSKSSLLCMDKGFE